MPRKRAYQHHEVIEKAMYSFWKHGYEGTSVRTLEKDMGINQFSIYSSFKSKKGVFVEVLKMYKQHVQGEYLEKLLSENSGLSEIEDFLKSFARAIRSGKVPNGCLMVNTSAEIYLENEELFGVVQAYFQTMRNIFLSVLDRVQSQGRLDPEANINQYANFLLGVAQGMTVAAKVQDENQVEDFIDLAMKNII